MAAGLLVEVVGEIGGGVLALPDGAEGVAVVGRAGRARPWADSEASAEA